MHAEYCWCATITIAVLTLVSTETRAAVTQYTSKSDWLSAIDGYSTADFTGFSTGTFITGQYSTLGLLFTDGNDSITPFGLGTYPQDGYGLDGNGDIHLSFVAPQYWIGCHFPGFIRINLYYKQEIVFASNLFGTSGGDFGGLLSTTPFDAARIFVPFDGSAHIDNLYFGPPIPAPAAASLLMLAVIGPRRRRRM